MFRHQRGRKYLPLPMSGESKEAISWYFMISHLVISCRLLWLPMTSQDFDRYPQIWVPSLQTITCWHQENESWLVKIPDHTAFSAAGAGGTSWLEATTKCNINCWGIKEAGNTGHWLCMGMLRGPKEGSTLATIMSYHVISCHNLPSPNAPHHPLSTCLSSPSAVWVNRASPWSWHQNCNNPSWGV